MSDIANKINTINETLPQDTKLVAVSKFHPVEAIKEAYDAGQRIFGESRPQELAVKAPSLPKDIQWHFIGHLQTNKVKMVLPYAYMIQSIDSLRLLEYVNDYAVKNGLTVRCLLELHLGAEDTKHGFTEEEIYTILQNSEKYPAIHFHGLMGMATNTDDEEIIRADFKRISELKADLNKRFPDLLEFNELSIGMSDDFPIALEYGATMIRVGTMIFGNREY